MAKREINTYYPEYSAKQEWGLGVEITKPSDSLLKIFNKKKLPDGSEEIKILDIKDTAFNIGKVCLRFTLANSIPNPSTGKKQKTYIVFYLDTDDAIALRNDINSGRVSKMIALQEKNNAEKVKKSGQAATFKDTILEEYSYQGGSTDKNQNCYFKGMNISYIAEGKGILLNVSIGPGKKSQTGGYVPVKDTNRSTESVSIFLNTKDMKRFANSLGLIEGYLAAQYVRQSIEQHYQLTVKPEFEELKKLNNELKDALDEARKQNKELIELVKTVGSVAKISATILTGKGQNKPIPQVNTTPPAAPQAQPEAHTLKEAPKPQEPTIVPTTVPQFVHTSAEIPVSHAIDVNDLSEDELPF